MELKPCPFCGEKVDTPVKTLSYYYFQMGCTKCGGRGPEEETMDDAITAWNNRAE